LRGLGYFGLLSTNFNNQAGINAETLKAVRLPVPNSKTQEEIATEIALRRDKAHRLCDEAHKIWDEAKSRFEKELLGPEKGMEETRIFSPNGGRKR
jgi:restriction endonuclease S subunit